MEDKVTKKRKVSVKSGYTCLKRSMYNIIIN